MTTIDRDDGEAIPLSSHREWIEDREREQQDRDKKAVERFLAGKSQDSIKGPLRQMFLVVFFCCLRTGVEIGMKAFREVQHASTHFRVFGPKISIARNNRVRRNFVAHFYGKHTGSSNGNVDNALDCDLWLQWCDRIGK
jgi:hypothetical protein